MKNIFICLFFIILITTTSCNKASSSTVENTKEGKVVAIEHIMDWWAGEVTDIYFSDGQVIRVKDYLILAIYGNYKFFYYDKAWHYWESLDWPIEQK